MKRQTKKFLKELSLSTPLEQVKEHCKTEEDTAIIMNNIYKLMSSQPQTSLSEDLKFTFAGEKVQKDQTLYISIDKWEQTLEEYYHAKDKEQKLKAMQKIIQVFECGVKVVGDFENLLTEEDRKEAKKIFNGIAKDKLKTSLIQRKMGIGYGKAVKIKEYLQGEDN